MRRDRFGERPVRVSESDRRGALTNRAAADDVDLVGLLGDVAVDQLADRLLRCQLR